jgi:hypothetical protein
VAADALDSGGLAAAAIALAALALGFFDETLGINKISSVWLSGSSNAGRGRPLKFDPQWPEKFKLDYVNRPSEAVSPQCGKGNSTVNAT